MAVTEQILSYFLNHWDLLGDSDLSYYIRGKEGVDMSKDPYEDNFNIKLFITDHTDNIRAISEKIQKQPKRYFQIYSYIGSTKSGTQIKELLTSNGAIQPVIESGCLGDTILELGEIIRKDPKLTFMLVITTSDQPADLDNTMAGILVYAENLEILDPAQALEKLKLF